MKDFKIINLFLFLGFFAFKYQVECSPAFLEYNSGFDAEVETIWFNRSDKTQLAPYLINALDTDSLVFYLDIFEEGKLWISEYNGCDGGNEILVASKDSIINGLSYHELIDSCYGSMVVGYFRTNDRHSKVWYLADADEEERLIMDLDLELGDEFTIGRLGNEEVLDVISVDTVDGRKIVSFSLAVEEGCDLQLSDAIKFKFIEGIGPSTSLTYWNNYFGNGFFEDVLHCVYLHDAPIFKESLFEWDCSKGCLVAAPRIVENLLEIQLFPNPTRHNFVIKSKGKNIFSDEIKISIFSSTGQKVLERLNYSIGHPIESKGFGRGLYLVKIEDFKNRYQSTRKLFVH